jgi:phosphoglycolate phosphatase-like HAD superfamily hydrolase
MERDFVVFYDLDGTLLDSLPAHIKFLRDINKRFGCKASIPDPHDTEECKKVINSTSMREFVIAAGLPEKLVPDVMESYTTDFPSSPRYRSDLFLEIPEMVKYLNGKGIKQGILSANYRQNIEKPLKKKDIQNLFYPVADRILLDSMHSGKKSSFLKLYRGMNELSFDELFYVGDTYPDYEAAQEAEVAFIGVSWGWQFSPGDDTPFPLVDSVQGLEKMIIDMSKS